MELAVPITVYWDLPASISNDELIRKISADIVECHPLMLQLHVPGADQFRVLTQVLDSFRESGIAIIVTIPMASLPALGDSNLSGSGIRELLLEIDDFRELPGEFTGKCGDAIRPGLSCVPSSGNWRNLPALVRYCRDEAIKNLVFPMQRLFNNEEPFYLTGKEQKELAAMLDSAGGLEGIRITIHDPFLWRAFHPDTPFPQGGCQAANTMIAIAPDGGVYPCPTLPVRLGTLCESTLKEILASAAKKEFRARLLEAPKQCEGCPEMITCRGGCRGRGYRLHDSLDGIDIACRQAE